MTQTPPAAVTGRCYCGHSQFSGVSEPSAVSYCHCSDCRRMTGAPVAAFAAFPKGDITFTPALSAKSSIVDGAERFHCPKCGSPLAGWFSYLPDKLYVPIGILDQADRFPPTVHAYDASRLSWLHIEDDVERFDGSARSRI